MKTTHLAILTSFTLATALHGETTATSRTYLSHPLEVRPFTPPQPPVETPIPTMRIDSSITVPAGKSHTLTILRGEPSTLPDIPEPVIVESRPPRQLNAAEIACSAERRRCHLNFNAETYDNGVSVLRWQHPDTAAPYEAICGFDVNLLAGVGHFISGDKTYQISFVPPGVRPTVRHRFSKVPIPKPPQSAPNTVTLIKGDANDPVGIATAILLRNLIASEESRLIAYQQQRLVYQKAAAAWHKANPVLQRDETVWFQPHRGSRYLTNPTPEKGIAK